jgi:hypothetical protein
MTEMLNPPKIMNNREVEQLFDKYDHHRITSGGLIFFEVVPKHIELLKRLNIFWRYSPHDSPLDETVTWLTGAPSVNTKRPYGNSGIAADVAEIIGVPQPDWDAGETWTEEQMTRFRVLHRSMAIVLEIACQCNGIAPGMYVTKWLGYWMRLDDLEEKIKQQQGELKNAVLLHQEHRNQS